MQLQTKMPAFADFSLVLAQADILISPSEVHGILCSLICSGRLLNGTFWFDTLFNTLGINALHNNRALIINLYDTTCRQLSGLEQDFQLLLPNKENSFTECALALSYWCKGFSYGLEKADVLDTIYAGRGSQETQEAIECIADVGNLNFDEIEVSIEHDKAAYNDVVDFVRTATLKMYAELTETPVATLYTPASTATTHLH